MAARRWARPRPPPPRARPARARAAAAAPAAARGRGGGRFDRAVALGRRAGRRRRDGRGGGGRRGRLRHQHEAAALRRVVSSVFGTRKITGPWRPAGAAAPAPARRRPRRRCGAIGCSVTGGAIGIIIARWLAWLSSAPAALGAHRRRPREVRVDAVVAQLVAQRVGALPVAALLELDPHVELLLDRLVVLWDLAHRPPVRLARSSRGRARCPSPAARCAAGRPARSRASASR